MAKLAIKGHSTRGNEVIKILEMLGGNNLFHYSGDLVDRCYYIGNDEYVGKVIALIKIPIDSIVFTLEEFLEKYPYKIGGKVIAYAEGCLAQFTIQDVRWNYEFNKVEYKICSSWYDTSLMQPYKEETMDKASKAVFEANTQCCDISNKIIKKETMNKEISGAIVDRFICLEGYDFYDDKGNIIDTKEIIIKKKKPKYPKTYEECCKVLLLNPEKATYSVCGLEYKRHLIVNLQRLIICRDAYWKIAGNWKPNFNDNEGKFVIAYCYGKVYTNMATNYNRVLVFPTEEMRDAFYENFKELIEECNELL